MTAAPRPGGPLPPSGPGPRPLTVSGLLLLDPHGHDPTEVESITFDDMGIGVVRSRGQAARILPWAAVITHAVEPWAGGVIPGWLVEPESSRAERIEPTGPDALGAVLADPGGSDRPLPHADAGAMISIQTRTGTYRFLRSGGDPTGLATRIAEFAVRHRGADGVSTVTTVADRRRLPRTGWARARPWFVMVLIVIIAASVTVILLQSAGAVHLPFLGGGGRGGAGPVVDRPPPA